MQFGMDKNILYLYGTELKRTRAFNKEVLRWVSVLGDWEGFKVNPTHFHFSLGNKNCLFRVVDDDSPEKFYGMEMDWLVFDDNLRISDDEVKFLLSRMRNTTK